MQGMPVRAAAAALSAAFLLAGCYSKSTHDSPRATKIGGAPIGLKVPRQPQPSGTTRPVPPNLKCGRHLKPVWAYMRFKIYYVPSDPLYGRTKEGMYMCPREAAKQGYVLAGPPPTPGSSATP